MALKIDTILASSEGTSGPFSAINGIIKNYYTNSGSSVNADSFVEFVNSTASKSEKYTTSTNIYTTPVYSYPFVVAEKLSDTRVLVGVAHFVGGYDTTTQAYWLYCFTIQNGTVSYRSAQVNVGTTAGEEKLVLTVVNSTKAVVACTWMDSSYKNHVKIYVANIASNGSISLGSPLTLSDTKIEFGIKTTSGRVALIGTSYYDGGSTNYGVLILTVGSTTVSIYQGINNSNYSSFHNRCILNPLKLPNGKIFIAYGKNGFKARILTPTANGFSEGPEVNLFSEITSDPGVPPDCKLINENTVLCGGYDGHNIYLCTVSISGTTITPNAATLMREFQYPEYVMGYPGYSLAPLDDGSGGVIEYTYASGSDGPYIIVKTFNISNKLITNVSSEINVETQSLQADFPGSCGSIKFDSTGTYICFIKLAYNNGEIVGDGRYHLAYNLINTSKISKVVKTASTKIDGVALTNGSNINPAQVLILK